MTRPLLMTPYLLQVSLGSSPALAIPSDKMAGKYDRFRMLTFEVERTASPASSYGLASAASRSRLRQKVAFPPLASIGNI